MRQWLIGIGVLNVLFVAWLIFHPSTPHADTVVANIAQFGGPLLALVLALRGRDANSERARTRSTLLAVRFLQIGVLCFVAGQSTWTYYELIVHRPLPLASWPDAGFLSAYPALLIGLLLLQGGPLSLLRQIRVVLDALIIMGVASTVGWYVILGPIVLSSSMSTIEKVLQLAYPVWDFVLLSCLLLIVPQVQAPSRRRAVRLLALALGCIITSDMLFTIGTLRGTYATGALSDVGWPLGYMLVVLAARTAGQGLAADQADNGRSRRGMRVPAWSPLLPSVMVLALGVLVYIAVRTPGDSYLLPGIYTGGALLVVLVLLRQVLTITENTRLYRALHDAYGQLESNNQDLVAANRRLETLATIDPLTDLPNHGAMIDALDRELSRATRSNEPCAVIFVDLDHFKALNDGYGHGIGDDVLRQFGSLVRAELRAHDILGRWGGEEFVLLLPQTDREGALQIAERVRHSVATHSFTVTGAHLTCSLGVAVYPDDSDDRDGMVAVADRAMYTAKHLGRNQVRAASDSAVLALALAGERGSREEAALTGIVDALVALVEVREHSSSHPTRQMSTLTLRLAHELGCDAAEARLISLAFLLRDVGKVALPDTVLQKTGDLNADEWQLVHGHPAVGANVLSRVPALRLLAPTIRSHHEHWDGSGYPDALAGAAIPMGARILAVVDAYGAILSDRPYRQAVTRESALAELRRCAGTQFDPTVVAMLEQALRIEAVIEELPITNAVPVSQAA